MHYKWLIITRFKVANMFVSNFFSLQGHLNIVCQVVDLTAICADILVNDIAQWLCNRNAGKIYIPCGILINFICQDLKSSPLLSTSAVDGFRGGSC